MTLSSFFTALSAFVLFASPAPSTPAPAAEGSEYVVGVVALFEDGSFETIEEKEVPVGLEFETETAEGEATIKTDVLNNLLESRHAKTYNGKTIANTFSFITQAGCSSQEYRVFVYKCYVQNTFDAFDNGCFTPNATHCSCYENYFHYPCFAGCEYLIIWCNNA